ncbi:MAG: phosphatidate cytidylyltransferase [Candidatus Margulisbacteria bacterium]|nr:phosphatidate cytidylyltransferase [Candidatus Margulisiibacteriota bacterium]
MLTLPYIFLLRMGQDGLMAMWFACVSIWTVDIFAFFGGKWFGSHKIAPHISPNKTIEGSLTGLLGCIGVAVIFVTQFGLDMSLYLPLGFAIGILSQVGDFHESLTKRHFKIKDSSHMLPGHGGFYDRADSVMLVMPLVYFIING